ncbi:N-acetylneuraminate 9-O-acetyltransferase-like isoform X2 [Corticium candelabrum]|uniref:N-acetylneuraminate 9-O-acetyltransferase-like isoform X2 n=1 Tax=Corticium candelabrum TaxID=121492 RepID=UPI002E26951F|nr:N-acetylneuraminate 9-O-acetyltransferase-like isoform X2 [Corticium candelabrum]
MDATSCLRRKRVAVVGDSRMRDIFLQLRSKLTYTALGSLDVKVHSDMNYQDLSTDVSVRFYWKPLLDESMHKLWTEWAVSPHSAPHIIVWSSALWVTKMQGFGEKPLKDFKANLTKLKIAPIKMLRHKADILWIEQLPLVEDLLVPERPYTNNELDKYNAIASDVLAGSDVEIVSSARVAALGRHDDTSDGMHYRGQVLQLVVDLILNKVCNAELTPRDATCCLPTPHPTLVQLLTGVFFLLCCIAVGPLWVWKSRLKLEVNDVESAQQKTATSVDVAFSVVSSLAKFGLILLYTFLADRTPLFMKETKVYHISQFLVLMAIILILGIMSFEPVSKAELLNRDQTEEWRGWMQLVILAYHYVGASQELRIYVWIRVLVASYIFMSAYGHFSYFWSKGDYGLVRVCQVLFRLNLLTVLLCLTMDRPYQAYYFVPLISFCFLVVYASMSVWPRVNVPAIKDPASGRHLWMMAAKILVLFFISWFLWSQEWLFDSLFSWWPLIELFRTEDGKVREWRFRSGLDRFNVVYGLVFGLGVFVAKQREWIASHNSWLVSSSCAVLSVVLSAVGLLLYAVVSIECTSKPHCNAIHTWLSFYPLTAFIILRNVPPMARSHYNTIYAWVGKISLELFISQYHIWLANDTKSLLVFIPGYPLVNAVVMSFIFVCIAHEISAISGVLAQHAVPKESKALKKRLLWFAVFLVLVWALRHPTVRQKFQLV